YHSPTQQHSAEHRTHMADPTDNPQHEAPDPLTVGELITLQQAAEYANLSRDGLQSYIRRKRLKAKKLGSQWVTTRAAVDEYLLSRDFNSIPKKYRNRS
ncbi:MAG: hypothetical protein RLZZ387_3756, partial [Chloroflexota bacterium]